MVKLSQVSSPAKFTRLKLMDMKKKVIATRLKMRARLLIRQLTKVTILKRGLESIWVGNGETAIGKTFVEIREKREAVAEI